MSGNWSGITELCEAWVHQVLHLRGVYNADLFARHRLYGLALHKSRHPDLNTYILSAIESLKVCSPRFEDALRNLRGPE
jgi:hypothetical protein